MTTISNTSPKTRILHASAAHPQQQSKVVVGPVSKQASPAIHSTSVKMVRSETGEDYIEIICACGEKTTIRCDYE